MSSPQTKYTDESAVPPIPPKRADDKNVVLWGADQQRMRDCGFQRSPFRSLSAAEIHRRLADGWGVDHTAPSDWAHFWTVFWHFAPQAVDLVTERDALKAENVRWRKKADTWMASPDAAQRLDGYRELADRVRVLEAENARLREALQDALHTVRGSHFAYTGEHRSYRAFVREDQAQRWAEALESKP